MATSREDLRSLLLLLAIMLKLTESVVSRLNRLLVGRRMRKLSMMLIDQVLGSQAVICKPEGQFQFHTISYKLDGVIDIT